MISRSSAGSVVGEIFCNSAPPAPEEAGSVRGTGERESAKEKTVRESETGKRLIMLVGTNHVVTYTHLDTGGITPVETSHPVRERQILRLQVKSDLSIFDSDVQSDILKLVKQKLDENGMMENTTVTWRVKSDGQILHKKKTDL
ncbi:hypothetical protein QTP70_001973 [Hemibagrus guttatus]|uniref:Uncharacterized protein n=1 Tax=Hemibagrus guttatus TaxID=175788 RepID=A0AAE0QW24_9TELE|nr:hypothetical protein QTP70_001973 [Hemibagrus guttatus]